MEQLLPETQIEMGDDVVGFRRRRRIALQFRCNSIDRGVVEVPWISERMDLFELLHDRVAEENFHVMNALCKPGRDSRIPLVKSPGFPLVSLAFGKIRLEPCFGYPTDFPLDPHAPDGNIGSEPPLAPRVPSGKDPDRSL